MKQNTSNENLNNCSWRKAKSYIENKVNIIFFIIFPMVPPIFTIYMCKFVVTCDTSVMKIDMCLLCGQYTSRVILCKWQEDNVNQLS